MMKLNTGNVLLGFGARRPSDRFAMAATRLIWSINGKYNAHREIITFLE